MAQINFTINPEYEKELFSFLINKCKCCVFLPESITGEFLFGEECEITFDKYLVSPLPADFIFDTQIIMSHYYSQKVRTIYPFDKNGDFLPFLEYEREPSSDNTNAHCRLYFRTLSVSPQFKKELKKIYNKARKWITDNATGKRKVGNLVVYDIDEFAV